MKKIIQLILKFLARRVIKKYNPLVIGITGSVGKTSTKEALFTILKEKKKIRASPENYNNEIGLPLTILGFKVPEKKIGWLKIFWQSLFDLPEKEKYPEILILEMAADRPGDISYLLKIVKPQIGILTAVSAAHLEYFKSVENVFEEKKKLIEAVPSQGWVILNKDDKLNASLEKKVKSKILTYGLQEAMVEALEISLEQEFKNDLLEIKGLFFKVKYEGNLVPVFLKEVVSLSQVYAVLAALAVGLSLNFNLLDLVNCLSSYESPAHRFKLIKGKKETLIIDDSYNSSPKAVEEALKTLAEIKVHKEARKWIVLGEMLELGKESEKLHYELGKKIAKEKIDYLLTYGEKAKAFSKGAVEEGMVSKNIFSFEKQEELINFLKENIKRGDLIFIKGSRKMKMEKIVEALK